MEKPRLKKILVIDNYDSFTWNLVNLLREEGAETTVIRNDDAFSAESFDFDGILISPGPGRPEESGNSILFAEKYRQHIPILGICLGHQVLAMLRGGSVVHSPEPVHGKTYEITHNLEGLFEGIPSPLTVMRYHSLLVDPATVPPEMRVTAKTNGGEIMAFSDKIFPSSGIQFHPESILTAHGGRMIRNWLFTV